MARFLFLFSLVLSLVWTAAAPASAQNQKEIKEPATSRMELFQQMQVLTGIPWYYLAAIDQFERNIQKKPSKPTKDKKQRQLFITISPDKWAGLLNPNPSDKHLKTIQFFHGMGKDGSGDQLADADNDVDVLYTFASYLAQYGYTEDDLRIGLWDYYKRDKTVDIISEFAQIFHKFNKTELTDTAFPLPLYTDYSYRSTWGDARGWGGNRIHEGCDLFSHYGTPVRSVCYGYIEVMGWNRFGGWRVGIRDLNNYYHYYAHLGGFNKKHVKVGDIVKPGDVVGWVGSSGYGKPGTQGKFPPHLHYGMYKDNGKTEWAFDPYPHLRKWEREETQRKKKR
jgi:peptidoglycan LD-endopeptidase LytH